MSDIDGYLGGDDPYTFIARLFNQQLTMEMHLVIAKSAGSDYGDVGNKEYQKAIKMAQERGSYSVLKKCYLQQISEFVDVRDGRVLGPALEAIENYLKLDD